MVEVSDCQEDLQSPAEAGGVSAVSCEGVASQEELPENAEQHPSHPEDGQRIYGEHQHNTSMKSLYLHIIGYHAGSTACEEDETVCTDHSGEHQ